MKRTKNNWSEGEDAAVRAAMRRHGGKTQPWKAVAADEEFQVLESVLSHVCAAGAGEGFHTCVCCRCWRVCFHVCVPQVQEIMLWHVCAAGGMPYAYQ